MSTGAIPLLCLPLAVEMIDAVDTAHVNRIACYAGGSQQVVAGSGTSVIFIEGRDLSVSPADASPALLVITAGGDISGATELNASSEATLEAGDALVMPAGSEAANSESLRTIVPGL